MGKTKQKREWILFWTWKMDKRKYRTVLNCSKRETKKNK